MATAPVSADIARPQEDVDFLKDNYWDERQLAGVLQCHCMTLRRWREIGSGPLVTHIGKRIFYKKSNVQRWLDSQEFKPRRLRKKKKRR